MTETFDEKSLALNETLEAVYERIWTMHDGEPFRALDESLGPRPPEMLLAYVERMGLPPGARLSHLVEIIGGRIESLPFAAESFDLVWCRDMLVHVPDINAALNECARVLRRGGHMLVLATHSTELLMPGEVERAFDAIGVVAENLSPARLEAAFAAANLSVASSEYIGSELIEFYEERDRRASRELMRLARMTRAREKFVAELGPETFDIAQALYRWTVYHLLGKIGANVYVLRKDS
jgi:SAM-dependent methyltransferase